MFILNIFIITILMIYLCNNYYLMIILFHFKLILFYYNLFLTFNNLMTIKIIYLLFSLLILKILTINYLIIDLYMFIHFTFYFFLLD